MQVVQVYGRERLEVIGAVVTALQRSGKVTLLWLLGEKPRVYRLGDGYYGVSGERARLVVRLNGNGKAEIINVAVKG